MTQPWSSKSRTLVTTSALSPETSNSLAYSCDGCQQKGGLQLGLGRSGPMRSTSGSTSEALCWSSCSCETTETSCCSSSRERAKSSSSSRFSTCFRKSSASCSCTLPATLAISFPKDDSASSDVALTTTRAGKAPPAAAADTAPTEMERGETALPPVLFKSIGEDAAAVIIAQVNCLCVRRTRGKSTGDRLPLRPALGDTAAAAEAASGERCRAEAGANEGTGAVTLRRRLGEEAAEAAAPACNPPSKAGGAETMCEATAPAGCNAWLHIASTSARTLRRCTSASAPHARKRASKQRSH
mmetsp:Transcript_152777/g.490062  ORF Transcript_152777/g.490062 Transcript_152777/m.490062 type:complete len:299 (-) Transcript_152777:14-910(-)